MPITLHLHGCHCRWEIAAPAVLITGGLVAGELARQVLEDQDGRRLVADRARARESDLMIKASYRMIKGDVSGEQCAE
jgi:hypothetical protein